MSGNKHPKPDEKMPADLPDNLEKDPGIGRSKGRFSMTNEPPIEGDNTFEGDVMNDSTKQGGVNPSQKGRTNK